MKPSSLLRRRSAVLAALALLCLSSVELPDLRWPRGTSSTVPAAVVAAPVPAIPTTRVPAAVAVAPRRPSTPASRALPGAGAARTADARPTPQIQPRPGDLPRGSYRLSQPGDTAARLAAAYGLPNQWVVYDANPVLVHPDRIPQGTWLYLPHPDLRAAPRPRPGQAGYTGRPSSQVIVDVVWLYLAACESSGRWNIDSGNGFYGGLQFTLDSWRSVGGQGLPSEAPPIEQIARADALQRIQGWIAWPMCAERLGLVAPGEGRAHVERVRARQAAERAEADGDGDGDGDGDEHSDGDVDSDDERRDQTSQEHPDPDRSEAEEASESPDDDEPAPRPQESESESGPIPDPTDDRVR